MGEVAAAEKAKSAGGRARESLLSRKYVIPFVLACVILACNQATGVNSIIGYNTNILLQAGLSDVQAHWGYVILTLVNFLLTMVGVLLVDRKRPQVPPLGRDRRASSSPSWPSDSSSTRTERLRVDCRDAVQAWRPTRTRR